MMNINLSEAQFKYLFKLLDSELRSRGIDSLGSVVDLYNTLHAAEAVMQEEPTTDEDIETDSTKDT